MTVTYENHNRQGASPLSMSSYPLEDRFEVLKDIGDGSFGSVTLARVRTAGAHIAKRNSMVAIKTMKKTFESFAPCLELREVIFLRTLPHHVHLVPALDIFLDPLSKKLHIAMEHMDGNLYQLMKSRDHRCLDGASVKSILYQILSGLDHIHTNQFFHRDIKPENILISTSAPQDTGLSFRRYSSMITPPSTPPFYSVKIADFGLARETQSRLPYTNYVSTRWYRAPEVLLRAGEYSAPVDMWALGAMAVEIATLKPLFPGGNEVDQVWRVCEIMGSPGNWYNKSGGKVGGGEWREGTKLAQKLRFSFPKMAPHSMNTILQYPQWPQSLSNFVTSCLMWDPKNRPTSAQAMNHEYFSDAVDPLIRPKSSTSRLLSRKHSQYDTKNQKESVESPPLSSKPSWFRKSLITRESAPAVPQHNVTSPVLSPVQSKAPVASQSDAAKPRPNAVKRATWTNGTTPIIGAPMPILPSIRPISPLSNAVTAQAHSTSFDLEPRTEEIKEPTPEKKKIGRQLSVISNGNHYEDLHRAEAERALNGQSGLSSPTGTSREGFFSHLRKRARRLSGRNQYPTTPQYDDVEANAGCAPWAASRSSVLMENGTISETMQKNDFGDLDKALQNVRYSLENSHQSGGVARTPSSATATAALKRHHSITNHPPRSTEDISITSPGPISTRTRRALHASTHPAHRYETPDEEEELLDEALHRVSRAVSSVDRTRGSKGNSSQDLLAVKDSHRPSLHHSLSVGHMTNPYPTPSQSAKRNGVMFNQSQTQPIEVTTPISIVRQQAKNADTPMWPTPPYEENEWATSAAASIYAAGSTYR